MASRRPGGGPDLAAPAGELGLAANACLMAAVKQREGLTGALRILHPGHIDQELKDAFDAALGAFLVAAEADLRPPAT